jgi:epoxyqueuosine reductase
MTDQNLNQQIKQKAMELGFDIVGITDASDPIYFQKFEQWIKDEHHGEMAYLSNERSLSHRADLQKVLPGCKSIVVLIKKINPSVMEEQKDKYTGRVASYAWNLDYHDTFLPLIKELAEEIEILAGNPVNHRYYTDTGPILERELAARAGLGWIGRNSMLINPLIGSFFLISEILLDMHLIPDSGFEHDLCGTCTRCISACPTNCILPNRTIDAKRCLSYLTIELKTEIPHELRSLLNEWIFGCDICQQVCPWNQRNAKPIEDETFNPRSGVPAPDLLAELKLDPVGFNKKFKGSPVKRTKRRGYLRNIITYLGNTGLKELTPRMTSLLINEDEPLIRQHTAWALGQIGGDEAITHLQQALSAEKDQKVLEEINSAIEEISRSSF